MIGIAKICMVNSKVKEKLYQELNKYRARRKLEIKLSKNLILWSSNISFLSQVIMI